MYRGEGLCPILFVCVAMWRVGLSATSAHHAILEWIVLMSVWECQGCKHPDTIRSLLVRDSDGDHGGWRRPRLLHSKANDVLRFLPDLFRIVLHPTWLRINLSVLNLVGRNIAHFENCGLRQLLETIADRRCSEQCG